MRNFSETRTRFLIRKLQHFLGVPVNGRNLREAFPHLSDREVGQALSYHTNGLPDFMIDQFVVIDSETQEVIDWVLTYEELQEIHRSIPKDELHKYEFAMIDRSEDETTE